MTTTAAPDTTAAAASPTTTAERSWLPGFALLALVWGSSFLFIKVGIGELPPVWVAFGRAGFGALTLLLVLAARRIALPKDPKLWLHLLVVSGFGVSLPFTLFGEAELHVSTALAGIWNATTPLIVLPVAAFVFSTEKMTARKAAGMAVGFAGTLVVLGVWRGVEGASLTGQLLCLGAVTCYGFAIPYAAKFLAHRPEPGVSVTAAQLLVSTIQLAVAGPLLAGAPPNPMNLSWAVIASVAALGILGTGVAFVINLGIIRRAGASTASAVTYVIPLVAITIGVLALGEHLHWNQPVGGIVVLLGVALTTYRRRPSPRPAAASPRRRPDAGRPAPRP